MKSTTRGMPLGAAAILAPLLLLASPPAHCALDGRTFVGTAPVRDAVVWLEVPGWRPPAKPRTALLDQRNLTFVPHVLAIEVGTLVRFPNHDRVFHNVFSYHNAQRFDLGLYPVGAVRIVKFDREGLSRLFCNIHPHMAAYIMAVRSPYFAVADGGGRFHIPSAPPGAYSFRAWRPGGPELSGRLVVRPGHSVDIRW